MINRRVVIHRLRFNELKEKYDKNKDTIMFKPFDFSERG